MNRCPITYELCGNEKYSSQGLRLLSRRLNRLKDFPYTVKEQLQIASNQALKISIQGVQPKLSVRLNIEESQFEIVERGGTYIFKPPSPIYDDVPQNEDVTMRLAKVVGLEVPLHGMVYNCEQSLTYFIRRFDHIEEGPNLFMEDFSQLLGFSRDTKYESSIEQMISVLDQYCTDPKHEKMKFFRIILFNFLVGNEDAHLKNFTLMRKGGKVEFSPFYDLVNTSIIINSKEEVALPLRGKKSNLKLHDFTDYLGKERLQLSNQEIVDEMERFKRIGASWNELICKSFLTKENQDKYLKLIQERHARLNLT